jgi:protein-S-isoprenylcysteine O-methyltransferase Ste14
MEKYLVFGIISILLILVSRRALFNLGNHGFYRFFAWECIAWLIVNNIIHWFDNPFSLAHLFSWLFLIISAYLAIVGVIMIRKIGNPSENREEGTLYKFERTTVLVDQGIFKYIRHPLYSSLIFLTWGIFLKNITVTLLVVSLISTVCLFLTALSDEKECREFFGDSYRNYMKRSKRFIPFLI